MGSKPVSAPPPTVNPLPVATPKQALPGTTFAHQRTRPFPFQADLCLCLGTSLQITPACDLPLRALRKQAHKKAGGKVALSSSSSYAQRRRLPS